MSLIRTALLSVAALTFIAFVQFPEPLERSTNEDEQELAPPSDLALLMRAMAIHADSVKAGLGKQDRLPQFPKTFRNLNKTTPTKGMHIDAITFPTFSKDYLSKLDDLYDAPTAERPQAYNALVQSCANCHGTHCPGPLMRIRKMYAEPLGQ